MDTVPHRFPNLVSKPVGPEKKKKKRPTEIWGITQLEGILEDVLIKVGKFIFPMDFVVIDIKENNKSHCC